MGMGDQKTPFVPFYDPVRCDVSGKRFSPGCIRSCPEPHVIAKYGIGGAANVSIWVCRMCKYHINEKWFGGVRCGYVEQVKV